MCVNVCVLVDQDEDEMRCQATADGYAVKKLSSIYLEWQIPKGPNMLQCRGLMVP